MKGRQWSKTLKKELHVITKVDRIASNNASVLSVERYGFEYL